MTSHQENTTTNVTIPANVVRYLRRGAKDELGQSLSIYDVTIQSDPIDSKTYAAAAARLDAARSLFEAVGIADDPRQVDVELDLRTWPRLLLRVLDNQHDAEVRRLQDAAHEGFDLPLPDLPALRVLADDIRKKTGAPPRHGRTQTFLERSLAARGRWGRPRDHE